MARKHNTKHNRTPGGYKRRLLARGERATPRMPELRQLRAWQGADKDSKESTDG